MNLSKNINLKIFATFIVSLIYAIIRYNVFGNIPWVEVPLFVTNKALSLTVIFILVFSIQKTNVKEIRKKYFKMVFILTSLHVFLSFKLLGPEHYQKFYLENELNLIGYFTLFFGITAFIGLVILISDNKLPTETGKFKISLKLKKILGSFIPIFIAGHLFSMGIIGWISPKNWHGYLIPISLIGFILILYYLKMIFSKKEKSF